MSNRINEKLATKLRTFPADDDSIVPVECPNERQFISDFVVITQYTKFSPTELQLKEKRKRIRSYSCFPAGFTYLIQDSLRMSSQAKTELMALSSHEMNLLFRDKAKVVPLQKFISLTSPSLVGHSKPLLEGFRKMVKGGHIIDLIYGVKKDGKENKDIKEEMTSIRRLKFILSQLYHSLVELESISHSYNTNNETPKLTEPSTGSNFEMAWNSSRKRYFEYALGLLNEKDRADFFKERKQRIKKLNDTKVVYIKESMKGMDYSKVEAERNTLLGVCKICDKPNIPFAKLSSHSQTCKKIKEIRQELLKVNEWLIAECQKAAQLKDKLFKLTTPVPTDRKKKNFNDTRSIQSNDKGSKLVQECMTPNPRTTRGFKNEKTFQPIANIPKNKEGEKEKPEVSKDQTAEDKKDKRPYKMRRCTSNDDLESVTIKKDDLKEERDKLLLTKVPKKETKNSMSEDEQPKPGQSNLSSSDDEIEKPSPSKQRFSHFKQYKLPSGQYNAVPETSTPLKVASSSTIRSNQDLAEPTEGLPVDEKVHPRLESKSSLLVDEKSHNPSKTQPTIDDNGEKKRDTADFLNDVYGTDSEKESSQNSDEQKEAQPASRPSSFFSRSVQQKKSFTPNQAESKIGNIGFSTKKDETEVPARVPEVPQSHAQEDLPTIKEQTKPISKDSSDKSSCFGDQLDLDDDSDEEDEKDEKTPPKGTEAFKKSSFGATSPQPVAPKVQEIAPVKEPEVIKPTPVSSLKLPIPLDKRGSMLTDNLKEPPGFISDLLNDSEEDSNCLGATSRSERSNPQQEEQTATTDLQTILPPKLAESSIVEEPKAVKEEETTIKPFILNMVKKKAALNETQSTKHDSTGLNLSVSASSQPQLDSKEAPAEETKEEPAKDDTEAKQKHKDKNALFKKVSKKKEFQTQIEEKKEESAPKTDLEDKQSLDQQNLEFKQLKLAQDCFSQVVWYGEEIKKYPYGETMLADNKMFDFLNSVISSSDYLEEVKQPSLKIKDMVAKRIAFIQEIRKLEAEDAKNLKEKNSRPITIGESSFRKPKGPPVAENSLFQPQKSLLGMMPASKPRKDSVDQNANPTGGILSLVKTPSNISKQTTNAPTDAGQTPTNQTSQKKSMMQMIKERNSTFTEKSSSKKFK